jgi:hypothetical protein
MVLPLLAPLFGQLAASMAPALGASVAGAVGAAGAAGPLVAAAAPKAIGAGIGSLLGGATMGDAALNALSFGAKAAGTLGGGGATNTVVANPGPPPTVGEQMSQAMGRPAQQAPAQQAPAPTPLSINPGAQNSMTAQMGSMPGPAGPINLPQPGSSFTPSYAPPGGLGSLPAMGGRPMPSITELINSLGPNAPAAQQFLMGQRGFS